MIGLLHEVTSRNVVSKLNELDILVIQLVELLSEAFALGRVDIKPGKSVTHL
jgi:hypothetical protein